jgi:HD superfamily phosphohydrolase
MPSQIDADRMDYLLRDAYYTGTEYGTFDLTRILRVIRHSIGINLTRDHLYNLRIVISFGDYTSNFFWKTFFDII